MNAARSLALIVTPNYYNYYKTNTPNMAMCLKIMLLPEKYSTRIEN